MHLTSIQLFTYQLPQSKIPNKSYVSTDPEGTKNVLMGYSDGQAISTLLF